MTLTRHAQERMIERLIPEEIINKAITEGRKMFKNNRLLYNYSIYVVVVSIDNVIVTVHYIKKISETLQDIAEKFDISISDATRDYLKYVI